MGRSRIEESDVMVLHFVDEQHDDANLYNSQKQRINVVWIVFKKLN